MLASASAAGRAFRAAARVGRTRRSVTDVPDEWSSPAERPGQNPAYRPSGKFRAPTMPRLEQKKNKLPSNHATSDSLALAEAFSTRLSGKGHNPVESL